MSNVSQFGGGVKSVQRGLISLAMGVTSNTATITAVDLAKSVLIHVGQRTSAVDQESGQCTLALTNSTTVTAARTASTSGTDVSWAVVEFY